MHQKASFQLKFTLLLLDVLLLVGSFALVFWLRLYPPSLKFYSIPGLWFSVFMTLMSLYILGAYDIGRENGRFYYWLRVSIAVAVAAALTLAVHYTFAKDRSGFFGRGIFLGGSALYLVISCMLRSGLSALFKGVRQNNEWLFLVDDTERDLVEKELKAQGFLGRKEFLSPSQVSISDLAHNQHLGIVVGTKDTKDTPGLSDGLVKAKFAGQFVADLASFYEINWQKLPYFYIDEEWIFSSEGFGIVSSKINLRIKRLLDVTMAVTLLLLTWPLMLLTALAVRLESPGPALFTQVRTGLNGNTFKIYKFRSMRADAEKNGAQWASANDNRITHVGKFIRKTRLDELPQLFNVLRGDMSFVGPRPERPEFNEILEKQIPFYGLRHMVPPGLTGWAQINYPYGASVEDAKEKLSYELYYIKNHSLLLDLRIILKTAQTVIFGKGR